MVECVSLFYQHNPKLYPDFFKAVPSFNLLVLWSGNILGTALRVYREMLQSIVIQMGPLRDNTHFLKSCREIVHWMSFVRFQSLLFLLSTSIWMCIDTCTTFRVTFLSLACVYLVPTANSRRILWRHGPFKSPHNWWVSVVHGFVFANEMTFVHSREKCRNSLSIYWTSANGESLLGISLQSKVQEKVSLWRLWRLFENAVQYPNTKRFYNIICANKIYSASNIILE